MSVDRHRAANATLAGVCLGDKRVARDEGATAPAGASGATAGEHAADAPPEPETRSAEPLPKAGRASPVALAVILAGGLAAGTLAAAALSNVPTYEIAQVEAADLDAAAQSIPAAEAATHIADAKACRIPMAVLTLRARPGQAGTVRIRSGDYWSPSIRVSNEALRVAIPYPAPYETGVGDLAIEGYGASYDVFLRPGWISAGRRGVSLVHVWWTPKQPC